MALAKILFVGCGGSGMDTLRLVRRNLEQRLELFGLGADDFPAAWQFAGIDVPWVETATDQGLLGTRGFEYIALTSKGDSYAPDGIDELLIHRPDANDDFVQWRPSPAYPPPIEKGAGNQRAFGRAVAANSLREASARLSGIVARMKDGDDAAGLTKVERAMGLPPAIEHESHLIIVSSMGGGAGSGIFFDVADLLKGLTTETWLEQSFAVLYEPSVFRMEEANRASGIVPNSVLAMSEVIAGQLHPYSDTPYFSVAQAFPDGALRGPWKTILVSQENSSGSMITQNRGDAYKLVAETLAAVTLTPGAADEVFDRMTVNPKAGFHSEDPKGPLTLMPNMNWGFHGLGFAKISTGHELFAVYAAERMAREILENVAELGRVGAANGLTQKVREGRSLTQEEAVTQLINAGGGLDDLRVRFLDACGLDEVAQSDQIVSRLLAALTMVGENQRLVLKETILGQIKGTTGGASIWNKIKAAIPKVDVLSQYPDGRLHVPKFDEALNGEVRRWSNDLQAVILDTATSFTFDYGIAVASRVIDEVRKEILATTMAKLRQENDDRRRPGETPLDGLYATLKSDTKKKASVDSVRGEIQESLDGFLIMLSEIGARDASIILLADLEKNVFGPLAEAMAAARKVVDRELKDDKAEGLSEAIVSPHLRPSPNHLLLTPIEQFPENYDQMIAGTGAGQNLRSAFQGIYVSSSDQARSDDRLDRLTGGQPLGAWKVTKRWSPNLAQGDDGSQTSAESLQVAFDISVEGVVRRCRTWLQSPDSPTFTFVKEDVRDWVLDLAGQGAEAYERTSRFVDLLQATLSMAPPQVDVDFQYLQSSYGVPQSDVVNWDGMVIPFSTEELGPDAAARAQALLNSLGVANVENCLVPHNKKNGPLREFVVFSTTRVLPFDAIQPLSGDVDEFLREYPRENFWQSRRTRPLPQMVVLDEVVVRQILKGWITARMLGLVEFDNTKRACSIVDLDGTRRTLLTSLVGRKDITAELDSWEHIAGALEASFVALLMNRHNKPEGWEALCSLFHLGDDDTSTGSSYLNLLPGGILPGLRDFDDATEPIGALGKVIETFADPAMAIKPELKWERPMLFPQIRRDIEAASREMRSSLEAASKERQRPPVPG